MIRAMHSLFEAWGREERGGLPQLDYKTVSLEHKMMEELAPTRRLGKSKAPTALGKEKRSRAPRSAPETPIADEIREVIRNIQDKQVVKACKLYYIAPFRNFKTAAAMMPRMRVGVTRVGVSEDYFKRLLFRAHKAAYLHIYNRDYEGEMEEI